MRPIRISLFLVCTLMTLAVVSQNNDKLHINRDYVKSYFTDSWQVVKSPLHWQGRQWIQAGILGGTCYVIFTQDNEIRKFSQKNRSTFGDEASRYFLDPLGKGLYTMPVLGGIYLYGALGNHPEAESFALQGIKIFIISGAFVQVFKQITHRHRPNQDVPPDYQNWDGPFSSVRYTAFPSGHTASAFAMATFLTEYFKGHDWVPWVSYTIASLAGLSRINDDEHWASDVFAGAVAGHFISRFLMKQKSLNTRLVVFPGGEPGISCIFNL